MKGTDMGVRLAVADKLLVAAQTLEQSGCPRFSAEDLVVAAWRAFPDTFGLKGYLDDDGRPLYPDSNRVYAEIMGSKPLRRCGLLDKAGKKLYQLTEAGRGRAGEVCSQNEDEAAQRIAISRRDERDLQRLFAARAASKWRSGSKNDISFHDACGFWSLSPGSNAKDLWSRFAHIEAVVTKTRNALGDRTAGSTRHGIAPLTVSDLNDFGRMHKHLQDVFGAELDEIKKRAGERK